MKVESILSARRAATGSASELLESLQWALRRIQTSGLGEGEHFARAVSVAAEATVDETNAASSTPRCDELMTNATYEIDALVNVLQDLAADIFHIETNGVAYAIRGVAMRIGSLNGVLMELSGDRDDSTAATFVEQVYGQRIDGAAPGHGGAA